ncbi:uncharacterized protein LOC126906884 [Daktulosphaira vitifoliae]|uniref:uncharacterized protein LOC126906884 n=1 Tax=Daktulosphaira vitifoliae TaxID=58002 RepID=UPI0021AAA5CC|nr:uncharacterized protein LOC126906884 [Daktulosphaira vitifoliae]XP_050543759.1 uncharacterized protein LOC126906884 [Daktulosphaira vitifoliae]XP_050543760.1 uncharacterized protein LOC126906884 [Daktulosphaira vitifoliae]XP_050543761.1 uncharacterized protein LOC126906884 [Daktulosphaira vitifoliae]XP_050543762.1 uncharacterized protein LOC126906884 [Daktulosphaira vitifoliae]XP_050543763.1 uncharacterized protein LOC126906884 [Daktulosphaira vitifoliae]
MPYLSSTRDNHNDNRLRLFNSLFRWKKSEKQKQKARQLSKSEVCIATKMSVKTRNSCPASPALSIPRSRDLFQDMEALRISRHDNPYIQKKIIASRESLLEDSIDHVSITDDIDIMAQEYLADMNPNALVELHQHMVRSPPPTSWPRIPLFKFDDKDQDQELLDDRCASPQTVRSLFHSPYSSGTSSCMVSPRYNHQSRCSRSVSETRGKL